MPQAGFEVAIERVENCSPHSFNNHVHLIPHSFSREDRPIIQSFLTLREYYNSILYYLRAYSTYKVSTSRRKKQNTHKQQTKQGNLYHLVINKY
jgi:hypothetical protein